RRRGEGAASSVKAHLGQEGAVEARFGAGDDAGVCGRVRQLAVAVVRESDAAASDGQILQSGAGHADLSFGGWVRRRCCRGAGRVWRRSGGVGWSDEAEVSALVVVPDPAVDALEEVGEVPGLFCWRPWADGSGWCGC